MIRHRYFRKGDIFKWLDEYQKSKAFLKLYKHHLEPEVRRRQAERYELANGIYQQFLVLKHSLSKEDFDLIECYLEKNSSINKSRIYSNSNVVENWELIVLKSSANQLVSIDCEKLGGALTRLRIKSGYYRIEAANIIGISESTLRSYEDGAREISIIAFYKLMQLYEVGDISDFLINLGNQLE